MHNNIVGYFMLSEILSIWETFYMKFWCALFCLVSEAPVAAPPPKKYQSYNSNYKTDEDKKEEVHIYVHKIETLNL